MNTKWNASIRPVVVGFALALSSMLNGCSDDPASSPPSTTVDLVNRAYVVSRDEAALTVIDLNTLEIIGTVQTQALTSHMAELNADFTKAYLSSTATDETVIIDTRALSVTARLPVAKEPAHLSLSRDGALLAVGGEGGDAVSFVDTKTDREVKRLTGVYSPKFIRFAEDGRHAYVANGGAHHITKVDTATLSIVEEISLEGFPIPTKTQDTEEGGFADVQIDHQGILWGAHGETGRVLTYDTRTQSKLGETEMGGRPWVVYAGHPFGAEIARHYMPRHADATVAVLDKKARLLIGTAPADPQSFGVNYSPLVPHLAFVMNRMHEDISVVDTETREIVSRIPVGGNTETAATTPDGRYIVATVGTANRVVVIDARQQRVIKTFDRLPAYPWSVTIPLGQNYCH